MLNKETFTVSLKLFIITVVSAFCLATVNKVTAPVIEQNNQKSEVAAQQEVLPKAVDFTVSEIPESTDKSVKIDKLSVGLESKDGKGIAGYVVTATSNAGYGGNIKVMVGISDDLKVNGIKILESSETAGLGANASKPKFSDQFKGADTKLTVVKGVAKENEISAISSATITSRAVTSCVNAAIEAAQKKAEDNRVGETVQKFEKIKRETEVQMSEEVGKE